MAPQVVLKDRYHNKKLKVSSGLSLSNERTDEPEIFIGLAEEYDCIKCTLSKVSVHRSSVVEGKWERVEKTVPPLLVLARLEPTRLRFDQHKPHEKVFVVLGSEAQLQNANKTLGNVLADRGLGSLTHGTKVSYEDIVAFDKEVNDGVRRALDVMNCERALPAPALHVEGVYFKSE